MSRAGAPSVIARLSGASAHRAREPTARPHTPSRCRRRRRDRGAGDGNQPGAEPPGHLGHQMARRPSTWRSRSMDTATWRRSSASETTITTRSRWRLRVRPGRTLPELRGFGALRDLSAQLPGRRLDYSGRGRAQAAGAWSRMGSSAGRRSSGKRAVTSWIGSSGWPRSAERIESTLRAFRTEETLP